MVLFLKTERQDVAPMGHQIPSWWWEHCQNSVKLDLKLLKIIAYPWLAFEAKRPVKTSLNRSFTGPLNINFAMDH